MKKFTNHTPGMRGITVNSDNGPFVKWLDAGQSVMLDPKLVIAVPDLGEKPAAAADSDDDAVKALTAKVADLEKQVETLTSENKALTKDKADLEKQVETLTKPPVK